MRWFVSVVSMTVLFIGGDNVGLVPDIAAAIGPDAYYVVGFAYLISITLTAALASIGAQTRQELVVTVRRLYGNSGKRIWAFITLLVCLPASTLTGVIYSGHLLQAATNIPVLAAGGICVLFYLILVQGWARDLLTISNWLGLLAVPVMMYLAWITAGIGLLTIGWPPKIDWFLAWALTGYNIGGIRPALLVESGAALARHHLPAVALSISGKLVESIFSLLAAGITLVGTVRDPLAVLDAVQGWLPFGIAGLFMVSIFCIFANAMVPAMMVNAKQLATLFGSNCRKMMPLGAAAIFILGWLPVHWLFACLAVGGIATCCYVAWLWWILHR